jgi:hypothetical protein
MNEIPIERDTRSEWAEEAEPADYSENAAASGGLDWSLYGPMTRTDGESVWETEGFGLA